MFIRRSTQTAMPSLALSFPTAAEGTKIAFVFAGSFFIHSQNTLVVFSFKPLELKKRVLIDFVLSFSA